MSRHNSSDIEQLLGLLFSAVIGCYRAALFIARTFRHYRDEIRAQRQPQGSEE